MAFQIKNFVSIVAGMINHMRGTSAAVTDFNVGSVARTLVEAPAIEIDELYIQMLNGLVEGIPVAVYKAFDFTRRPAVYATGDVTFSRSTTTQAVTIPQGTVVTDAGGQRRYETVGDASMAIGVSSVSTMVKAMAAGLSGNTTAHTIIKIDSPVTGVDAVDNDSAIVSGRDEETEEERKVRFRAYISTLARGTLAAIEYAVGTATVISGGDIVEMVQRVGIVEEVPGRVAVYIFNGSGATSDSLVTAAQQILDGYVTGGGKVAGYRPAGVETRVYKMTEQVVPLTCDVTPKTGYTVDATMISAIESAFTKIVLSVGTGQTLYLSELYAAISDINGVDGVTITSPSADITPEANVALTPGTVTVT